MFDKNYYCLVAGLREWTLESDTKGFDARAIVAEISDELSASDAEAVRLLYAYYDCQNIVARREGRTLHNPLGNLSKEEVGEVLDGRYSTGRASTAICATLRPPWRHVPQAAWWRALR